MRETLECPARAESFREPALRCRSQAAALADEVVTQILGLRGRRGGSRHPIVLLPPLSGSQLQWRLQGVPSVPYPWWVGLPADLRTVRGLRCV